MLSLRENKLRLLSRIEGERFEPGTKDERDSRRGSEFRREVSKMSRSARSIFTLDLFMKIGHITIF